MARWKIKNVGMKGVAMAVPKNVVKTSDFDFFSQEEAEVFVTDLSHESDYEALHLEQPSDHTRAFIKVQDGCNQFCSYCISPMPEAGCAAEAVKMW